MSQPFLLFAVFFGRGIMEGSFWFLIAIFIPAYNSKNKKSLFFTIFNLEKVILLLVFKIFSVSNT